MEANILVYLLQSIYYGIHLIRHIKGDIKRHAWHLPNDTLIYLSLENCSMLYVMVCLPQWNAVFYYILERGSIII